MTVEQAHNELYHMDQWTEFIEKHIKDELTTDSLADHFNLSASHFKRLFKTVYEMTPSDYIRKRRIRLAAEKIRHGMKYQQAAATYGFHSEAGFSRAFVKEFLVTPAEYSKGSFGRIELEKKKDCCGAIEFGVFKTCEILLETRKVFGPEQFIDANIPYVYWKKHGLPIMPRLRLSCNRERREDKVAFWYCNEDGPGFYYMVGNVVKEFQMEPDEEVLQVKVKTRRYAIFQTDSRSDEANLHEVLRIFQRKVMEGWVLENGGRIDKMGMAFERFVDKKVYLYIPLKK